MINDLINKLYQIPGVFVMIFADDIGIIADTRSALTKAIAIIEEWCLKNKMELNKRKS